MQQSYQHYLEIIKNICTGHRETISIPPEEQSDIARLAEEHCTIPFVLSSFRGTPFYPSMLQKTRSMMLNYYQIDQFTRRTVSLLRDSGINCIVLKGISLASCYPVPEYRKLGDLDLYISQKSDVDKAKKLLASNGYSEEDELSDHHLTYHYIFPKTGRRFLLELHYRVVGMYQYDRANQIVDQVYSSENLIPVTQTINGTSYSVLPPAEYVFYMIHHMLKHYLYSGFGIRLLCDFTFYLEAHSDEIDFQKIHNWCRESRISHLYEIVIETCRIYLGLPRDIDSDIHYAAQDCEEFISRILNDGDMGTDVSQELVGSTSYQKINFVTYFKEGHVQMKVRFPKASRIPILWPFLRIATFVCFVRNTYKVRNTTLRQTLQNFKKSNQKTKLVRIFDNSDS